MSKAGTPTGWDFNPSSWRRRVPLLVAAAAGSSVALYLPNRVEARAFFVAYFFLTYLTELMGGPRRWRTSPWTVIATSALTFIALAAVGISIYESASPHGFNASTEEIFLNALAVLMIGPIAGELLASLQLLRRLSRKGRSAWRALWGLDPKRKSTDALKNLWRASSSSKVGFR